ncbi:MAG: cbb3-type cytochrome oxidase subunit 3 [Calditrichota bacterium]
MIHDAITYLGASLWAIVGLVLCFSVFVGIVIWTYRGRRDRFERESRLPLDDDHRELNGTHS